MRWPLVSRRAFDAVERQRDALLQERNRLLDKLLEQSFGFQLNDSFPKNEEAKAIAHTEAEPEPAQDTEEEIQAREKAELMSVKLTRPSNLAPTLERIMRERVIRRAQAANPAAHPEVKARFEQIKAEVLKAKTVH